MLILTRRLGQIIAIQPHQSLRPATPIGRVFAEGPIEILVARIEGNQVRLGVKAHPELVIYRSEVGEVYVGKEDGGEGAV